MTEQEMRYRLQMMQHRQCIYNNINMRINNLRSAIRAGVDVKHDPQYVQEYLYLVSLVGEGPFAFENIDNAVLLKEDKQ